MLARSVLLFGLALGCLGQSVIGEKFSPTLPTPRILLPFRDDVALATAWAPIPPRELSVSRGIHEGLS
jgi:hypothetical protein